MVHTAGAPFRKVLIAHRSEISLRVQATCKALGILTIAIYTKEDAHLSFVSLADEAYQLSLSGSAGYCNQQEIITIALSAGADALHPGYGFLAENASFARRVLNAGLTWIGPDPNSIALMGDKVKARDFVASLGVPIIPGYLISSESVDTVFQQLQRQSLYPVLIKNPYSGGGKAMRFVASPHDFFTMWEDVVIESSRMGYDASTLLVEQYLENTRHVEVQIVGDGRDVVHLYDRECSVQRRYQKIIEEAPCQRLSKETKEKMYAFALSIARACKYSTVGTVEFIVLPDETFYFLEMNTRLQVEHAVTEQITGVDLVALQMYIAAKYDNVLPRNIYLRGYALECRIYAENPHNNFMPSTGKIEDVIFPQGIFFRHEHDLKPGVMVTSLYDPMLSKLVTVHETKAGAINLMIALLKRYHIIGITTNIRWLQALLDTKLFRESSITTQFLQDRAIVKQLAEHLSAHSLNDIALFAHELLHVVSQPDNEKKFTLLWKEQQWR